MSKIDSEQRLTVKIAYIGGGSMTRARTFMADLAQDSELDGEVRLYDIDYDAAKRNEIIGNRITNEYDTPGKWSYKAVTEPGEALTGADFVIISIMPGTHEHMRSDIHLPERLGIYQSVGDTTGPGGIIRALRAIPMIAEIAGYIKQYSPNARVINYSNPMGVSIRALYHVYPQIKAFGCCCEVSGTQELLADIIHHETGKQARREDIHANVLGINHFTWFNSVSYKEYDLMPLFAHCAEKYYESGFESKHYKHPDKEFHCKNRVKFDLFRKYSLIAAAGDRHLAEFMPGEMYLQNRKKAERWGFTLTGVDWHIKDRGQKAELAEKILSGEVQPEMNPSGEAGVLIIKALCGLSDIVTNVNLPNKLLQINNLPKDTVVESNALITRDSVRPVCAGELPDKISGLFSPHIENQTEVLNAALRCDRDAVLKAFERDPLICGRCSPSKQRRLADDMIKNTLDILPPGWSEY